MEFFKKWWWLILIIIVVLLIIYCPPCLAAIWSWITTAAAWITSTFGVWGWVVLGLGLAFMIDPEGTARFLGRAARWIGEVIGEIVTGAAKGLGLGPLLFIGIGAYLFFGRKGSDGQTAFQRYRDRHSDGPDEGARSGADDSSALDSQQGLVPAGGP